MAGLARQPVPMHQRTMWGGGGPVGEAVWSLRGGVCYVSCTLQGCFLGTVCVQHVGVRGCLNRGKLNVLDGGCVCEGIFISQPIRMVFEKLRGGWSN